MLFLFTSFLRNKIDLQKIIITITFVINIYHIWKSQTFDDNVIFKILSTLSARLKSPQYTVYLKNHQQHNYLNILHNKTCYALHLPPRLSTYKQYNPLGYSRISPTHSSRHYIALAAEMFNSPSLARLRGFARFRRNPSKPNVIAARLCAF